MRLKRQVCELMGKGKGGESYPVYISDFLWMFPLDPSLLLGAV